MKTRCSKLVRFPSVLGLPLSAANCSDSRRENTLRRLGACVMLAAAVFAAPLQAQIVFDATADFSITNGNPNGVWSYGWMPTDFSQFNLFVNNNSFPGWGPLLYGWYGWSGDAAPHILMDRGSGIHPYVPPGWLTLHPGPGEEPSVLRWTSPLLGSAHIQGSFLPGDLGTMQVAVRMGGEALWQATDEGQFDLREIVLAGETVDFVVYGGYGYGNTPLGAAISLTPLGGAIVVRPRFVSITENANAASVEVLRFGPEHLDEEVTVDYATTDETAHAGEDYTAVSGTLHFAAGETNKQIVIPILNDALTESEEQFRLVLSNPTGGVSLGNSNVVIRIQDNDPGVHFMTENVAVSETVGVVAVVVQRGDDLNLPFTVDYATVEGTARAGEDYVAASGTLHFAAGEINKEIAITILDDALKEPVELFHLVLSNPTGGVSVGNSNMVIWVQSDELLPYYVNVNNPNPVFPYTSWATAATNIQDAVDAAMSGDTVLVTNGVYAVGSREVSVLDTNQEPPQLVSEGFSRVVVTNSIRLESVNGPLVTAIEGVRGGPWYDQTRCVFLGNDAVLSGFTLTNGANGECFEGFCSGSGGGAYGGTLTNCTVTGNLSANGGGVAYCTLYNSRVSDNQAGGRNGKGAGAFASTLYNCTLTGNIAGGGHGGGGGAWGSTLYNCTLTGNSGSSGGGAYQSTLYNCTLSGNLGFAGGGARWSTLYNSTLTGNSADLGGGASGSTLYNCTLSGNSATADEYGGGYGAGAVDSTLYNCTVTGNSADVAGGGASSSTVFNSIFYYNSGGNYDEGTTLNYCCTTPLPTNGVGNITGPPLFMDWDAEDFRLREESPCIDAGTNLMGFPIMGFDAGWNWVVVAHITDPTDILGNTRFIDGNFDGTVAWDIGAYEFNSFRPPRFTSGPRLTANGWQLNITGAANQWVRLQRSSDLRNWENIWFGWMGSEGVKQVTDGDMGQQKMFYRAVVE